MESAISNERRFYQKAIGVVWGRGEDSVTGERKAEGSPRPPKDRASLVRDRVPRKLCSSPTQAHPHWSEWPQAFSVSRSNEKVIQIPGREFHRSPLGCWFRCNYKMDVAPSKKTTICWQKYSQVEYFTNFTLKMEIVMCLFLRLGSLGEFLY